MSLNLKTFDKRVGRFEQAEDVICFAVKVFSSSNDVTFVVQIECKDIPKMCYILHPKSAVHGSLRKNCDLLGLNSKPWEEA